MRKIFIAAFVLFLLMAGGAYSQEIGIGDPETLVIRNRQWSIYGTLHTNGLGFGFRIGKEPNIHMRRGFDFEYTYYRHFKERRVRLDYNSVIVYGKLNYFGEIRAGYGLTRVLNSKPYWGGVEFGYFFYGGLSLGASIPVYIHKNNENLTIERYDPEKHSPSEIYKKAPMGKGFKEMKVHPGIYLKTGLSFDFSKQDAMIVKLDFGAAADVFFLPVEKIAFSPKQYVLLTGFVTIHLGKRLAGYE